MLLEGKVCLITGATRGIGWATAELFMQHGATLILTARNEKVLLERQAQLQATFARSVHAVPADVVDSVAVRNLYADVFRTFRRLDVLVNNAGVLQDALLGMISQELIQNVVSTNLVGALAHLQEASRLMTRNKSGSIINLTSIIGRVGNEGQTVYAASKAAVIGMTYSAAKELAPKNVRVNAIAPGFIETDMTRQLPADKFSARLQSVKMGRIGQASDVAQAILFFASDASAYVTGQVLGVDGGMLI
jgi:3-oxoacyl-[acyl-carrier protein] reductase